MTYRVRYHPDVKDEDLPNINKNIQKRIKRAIEHRLLVAPGGYSEPLRRTLRGDREFESAAESS